MAGVFKLGGMVATRTDFTDQEWESLQKGVTGAGLLVSLSDRGFFDTFKEAGSLAKHLAQAKQSSSSGLVRELADMHGTGFGLTSSPDEVERETLEALRSAKATLESKAPDELDSYRQFVIEVARSVGEAAGGGETEEGDAIEKVESALR
jgi:hypothetical protein